MTGPHQALVGSELNRAIGHEVVRSVRHHVGRGPSSAEVFHRQNLVVVVMRDALTRADASLVAQGREELVLEVRRGLEAVMRADLVAAVEGLTDRRVEAFMSGQNVDPDIAFQLFVLDGDVPAAGAAAPGRERDPR